MTEREILMAALRWHTAHTRRLSVSAEQRSYQKNSKERTGFGGSSFAIGERLTPLRRAETAALRDMAKVCATVRTSQNGIADADVIDLPVLIGNGGNQ